MKSINGNFECSAHTFAKIQRPLYNTPHKAELENYKIQSSRLETLRLREKSYKKKSSKTIKKEPGWYQRSKSVNKARLRPLDSVESSFTETEKYYLNIINNLQGEIRNLAYILDAKVQFM